MSRLLSQCQFEALEGLVAKDVSMEAEQGRIIFTEVSSSPGDNLDDGGEDSASTETSERQKTLDLLYMLLDLMNRNKDGTDK